MNKKKEEGKRGCIEENEWKRERESESEENKEKILEKKPSECKLCVVLYVL